MKRLTAFIIILLGALFAFSAHADNFTFTGNEARAPKIFKDRDGTPRGIVIDVMKYIEKETGDKFTFNLLPLARAIESAENGDMGIIGFSKTSKRLEKFDYSEEPLYIDEVVLVVKKGKEFQFNNMDDLKGKKIGVARGASYGEAYDVAVANKVFEPVPGTLPTQQLAMLLSDRLDAVLITSGKAGLEDAINYFSPGLAGLDLAKRRDEFLILPKPFNRDPNYVAFAKSAKKTDFLKKVDRVLREANKSNIISKIIDNYSPQKN